MQTPKKNMQQTWPKLPTACILGGTFDPFHLGHQAILNYLQNNLHPKHLAVVPCKIPYNKTAKTSTQQRLEILKLNLKNTNIYIDTCDLIIQKNRNESILTVQHLRKKWPEYCIIWTMGDDVFASLESWQNWQEILNYCNFLIIKRHNAKLSPTLQQYLLQKKCQFNQITQKKHGQITIQAPNIPDISSTQIRNAIKQNQKFEHLITPETLKYLSINNLYTKNN